MRSAPNSDERYPYVEPMKAIYVQSPGGPENLVYGDIEKPTAGPGQALDSMIAAAQAGVDSTTGSPGRRASWIGEAWGSWAVFARSRSGI